MQDNDAAVVAVEADGLVKRFEKNIAVDRVSFQVRRGEIFGFLGPNGAGKTTTVRILTGVLKADRGSALIFGASAGSLEAKRFAGVVPEMANAYVDLSGWSNLMLMAELSDVPTKTARERATKLLRELGLFERKGDLVKGYSKGMKQRLILGMALIGDPKILFLDEPTSGLDVQSARLINDILRGLNADGTTIFLTTHDMDEANRLCNRVAIIDRGRIVATDAPEKLKKATSGMHSIEISFDGAASPESFEGISGVREVKRIGDKLKLYTTDPGELVVEMVSYSRANGLKIVSLNTPIPSLEDAFLALTHKGVS
jgi:ABC-2 type transport system ATP-binding protein